MTTQNPNTYPEADKNRDYRIVNGNSGVMPWVWEAGRSRRFECSLSK
ncbi:hypothetical protein [Microcoleus sp. Pol7_A1]